MEEPKHRRSLEESCQKLGLDVESVTLFDWLDADDVESFEPHLAER